MKKYFLTLLIVIPASLFSQSIDRQAINCAGGFSSNSSLPVSYTVGQLINTTENASNIIITQGFQQPGGGAVGIDEPSHGFSMNAYPNPTADNLQLNFVSDNLMRITIYLFDMHGREVVPSQLIYVVGNSIHSVNMSALPAGNYLIRIQDHEGRINKSLQVQKVN